MHYKFRHQVDDKNNRPNFPISVERTYATTFWEDRNCAWNLATSEVNTNLAWGHFQQDGKVDATLDFWRKLADECLVNSIEVDKYNEDVGSIPLRTCRMHIKGTCRIATAPKISWGMNFQAKKGAESNKNIKNKGA